MRSAGNFHPEWGYLAPAPSFMRTVRVALVATAIGAVAGAVVVVSLVERPGSNDDTAIAAHALLTRAPVITTPAIASRTSAPAVVKATPVATSTHPSAVATATPPAGAVAAHAVPQASTTLATVDKPNKPDKADSISPPLPLAAPTDATIASTGPVAAPAEADAAAAPDTAAEPPAPVKRSVVKRRRYEPYRRPETIGARSRWRDNGGFGPLFRLFSFRTGSSYSSN